VVECLPSKGEALSSKEEKKNTLKAVNTGLVTKLIS
jgi:hypothetical protein